MEHMDASAIRDSISCPITGDVMIDPVQGNDGHTYERSAIVEWLSRNPISPQTRQPMRESELKVNASIRFLCDKYHAGAFGSITIGERPKPKVSYDNIKLLHNTSTNNSRKNIMLSFTVDPSTFPSDIEHLSQDAVLVIDRSGSMNQKVEAKDADGNQLENGFSVQDIVNHAARTVVKTLDKNSRLSVIAFDNTIEVVLDLQFMTEMNQSTANSKIKQIKPRGQTNIYGALEKAVEILDVRDDKSRNSAILILTDGVPNVSPARGEVETLKKLRIKKNFTAPIYTFGFGYSLQRELLYDISKYANGANGHIPDGGMIATVFCNFIGTILATVVMNLQLHVTTGDVDLMGDYPSFYTSETESTTFDLGTVQYQQTRDIIFKSRKDNMPSPTTVEYYYTYKIGGVSYKSDTFTTSTRDIEVSPLVDSHVMRYRVIESIRTMINYNRCNQMDKSSQLFSDVEKVLKAVANDSLSNGLLKNLSGDGSNEGQVKMAVTNPEYFKRWGEFYLDQLSRSLNQQIKPNFKDEACNFGGDVFSEIVDRASDIFDTLEPPEPSLMNNSYNSYSYGGYSSLGGVPAAQPTRTVTLSAYNDVGGGCFDSNCTITMADGSQKILKNLCKGDVILSADRDNNRTTANVVCILEMKIKGGIREFVDLEGGLYITPWHPIKYNDEWVFPANIKEPIIRSCESIITLVLDNHHVGFINGHQCIMLGHGFTAGVLAHPYYGTQLVVDDLKMNYGWETGKVVVNDKDVEFIKRDNKIIKMVYDSTRSIREPAMLVETY